MLTPYDYMQGRYGTAVPQARTSEGNRRIEREYRDYVTQYDQWLADKQAKLEAQQSQPKMQNVQYRRDASGQTRTPDQSGFLKQSIADLGKRLAAASEGGTFGDYLSQLKQSQPFQQVPIPQAGQNFPQEQQMAASGVYGGQMAPAVGGTNLALQRYGAAKGWTPEAIKSIQQANERTQYAAALERLGQFNANRQEQIAKANQEAAYLASQQEIAQKAYEAALIQQANDLVDLNSQRTGEIQRNIDTLTQALSRSELAGGTVPYHAMVNAYVLPGSPTGEGNAAPTNPTEDPRWNYQSGWGNSGPIGVAWAGPPAGAGGLVSQMYNYF